MARIPNARGSRGTTPVRSGRKLTPANHFNLQGLDQTTPYDLLENRSPFLRNARLFAQEDEERRVTISTAKGPSYYSTPVGEALNAQVATTTGAGDQTFGPTAWKAVSFTATTDTRLTKVELNLRNVSTGTGHVRVDVYTDSAGAPGDLLAQSSILSSSLGDSYAYEEARFIAAPLLATDSSYWLVVYIQEGGTGTYEWSSTTDFSISQSSANSGGSWIAETYALNFKAYTATDGGVKGAFRYNPSNGTPTTIFFHGTSGYTVNEVTGAVTASLTGFNASAEDYYAIQADDKLWMVNGVDVPKKWDGATLSSVGGSPGVCKLIADHKNRTFMVPTNEPTKVIYSDINSTGADRETFEGTAYFYVPTALSSDPITALIPFQDNLIIFTERSKWVLSGDSLATFVLRQATGKKGAVNQRVVQADENYVYFLSDDALYRWNGADDEVISERIHAELNNMANPSAATAVLHNRKYRLYYQTEGSADYDRMIMLDITYREFFLDDGVHVKMALTQPDNRNRLIEFSDKVGAVYYGEQQYSRLGAPIDFDYWTPYDSYGTPASKKQVKRLYPMLRAQTQNFDMTLKVDSDFTNAPRDYEIAMGGGGDVWGEALWGAFTWGSTELIQPRLSVPGSHIYYQYRFTHSGVDNPVEILGYVAFYRYRRPK